MAVAVLPDGARFVSVSRVDKTAKLWTLDGGLLRTFAVRRNYNDGLADKDVGVNCVVAMPDGVHFVVGLASYLSGPWHMVGVRMYHVDGTLVHTFEEHNLGKSVVLALTVTRDGQHIISGDADKRVAVWGVASKSLVSTCTGHGAPVHAVAAMPDGQRILSGAYKEVRVWLFDGTLKNAFELHASAVTALVALTDNQHALSGSVDKTVKLFNVNDAAVLRTFKHHSAQVLSLALLPGDLRFASASMDNTARIVEHGLAPVSA
jgi:WD40 repeat protein